MLKRTICIQSPSHLKYRNGQLVVCYDHVKGQESMPEKTAPVEDLGMLILEHRQITISHYLLDQLAQANCIVVTCGENHQPSALLLPMEGNTIMQERLKAQVEASDPFKKQCWQQTVMAKINNQAAVLQRWGIDQKRLVYLSKNVKSGDLDNHEAQAAVYYWQHLFPPAWLFYRKRDGLPPNNLLNYGYALLRATMTRALTGAGLLPALGIFHRNRYNAFCLADDIMEPYRPYIDLAVRRIVDRTSHLDSLTTELKVELLNVLTADTMMNGDTSPLQVAMQRTAASLAKCYMGDSRKILYPKMDT